MKAADAALEYLATVKERDSGRKLPLSLNLSLPYINQPFIIMIMMIISSYLKKDGFSE